MNKIVIIGCGNVGMSYAYALLNQQTSVHEIILIDKNKEKCEGEAMDLNHCLAFSPSKIKVRVGDYKDCRDATIVCIAAGANQEKGETRMDLIDKNASIFHDIVKNVVESGFYGIFLIATNPLDIMTYITWKESNFPHHKVIGSGTSLDTARLRYMIGEKLEVNPKNIHAYVIGEHGDTEFVPWENATVGLQNIKDFLDEEELEEIYVKVRDAAYEIINKKGATCYGIGTCLVRITEAILKNENSILTVCTYDEKNDVFIGLPAVINKEGIRENVFVELTKEEEEKLKYSIDTLKKSIQSIK